MISDAERKIAYYAAVRLFQTLGEYMNTIAKKHSLDEAFDAQKQMSIRLGKESGERIRNNPDKTDFTSQTAYD